MSTEPDAAARTSADDLLVGLLAIWPQRADRARILQQVKATGWRDAAASASDGFAVLYLLATLRHVAPDIADRAADFLEHGSAAADLPQLAENWRDALYAGEPLPIPL